MCSLRYLEERQLGEIRCEDLERLGHLHMSPGHTSRSRFAPSVTALLPFVMVALLYHYQIEVSIFPPKRS